MRRLVRAGVAALAILVLVPASRAEEATSAAGNPASAPLSQREIAFHCLNRLAFGPRPGQVDEVLRRGWMAWTLEQLEPASLDDRALEERLARTSPSLRMTCTELIENYRPRRPQGEPTPEQERTFQMEANRLREQVMRELREAILLRAVHSNRQLQEVMVNFWRNHFNIDQRKDQCQHLAANYEEQVVRPHVFGRFEDMLMACAKHPAMLVYLDNVLSQRPLNERERGILERSKDKKRKSEYVQRLERQRGLNENYARELLELHTIGVRNENAAGGYSQKDIIEVARALTGWSVGFGEGKEIDFLFRDHVHDDQPKNIEVIKLRLPGDGGVAEGEEIIRRLARHPLTADFIAWKMCRYLVHDHPDEALVKRIAGVFLATGGDLKEVTRAILFDEQFYRRDNFRMKFKTPFEFVVSALRATGSEVEDPTLVLSMLERMGQAVAQCTDPTGYYDQREAWLDPGVLVYRWQFSLALASGHAKGVVLPKDTFKSILAGTPEEIKEALLHAIVPGGVDAATEARCATLIGTTAKKRELAASLLGALLGSPTFQEQ